MNKNSFSVAINQNPQTTHKIIKGINKPSYDYIVSVLSTFSDISANWLILGKEQYIESHYVKGESKEINHNETIEENKAYKLYVAGLEEKASLYKQIIANYATSLADKERIIEEKDRYIKEKERIILDQKNMIDNYNKKGIKKQ